MKLYIDLAILQNSGFWLVKVWPTPALCWELYNRSARFEKTRPNAEPARNWGPKDPISIATSGPNMRGIPEIMCCRILVFM